MVRECSLGKCCHLCGSTSHLQRECPERRSTFAEAVRRGRPSGGSDEGRRVEARPAPEQRGAEPAAEEVMEATLREEDVPISGSSGVVPPTPGAEVSVVAGQLVAASAGEGEEVQLTASASGDEVVVQEEAPPAVPPPPCWETNGGDGNGSPYWMQCRIEGSSFPYWAGGGTTGHGAPYRSGRGGAGRR